jgi:hypothetical protein
MLVYLNSEYDGDDVEKQYCIDLLTKKRITKTFKMNLTRDHYEDLQIISTNNEGEHSRLYNRLIKIIEQRALQRHSGHTKS